MRLKLATICAASTLFACAALATGAQADTGARIAPSFSPDRAGANAALTLGISYSNQQGGYPQPVSHAVVHLPAGLKIDLRGVATCPKARALHGGHGCPASSKVGRGSALMGAHLGSQNINETATLTAWRGPDQGGHPVLEIAGVGLTPLEERVVMVGVLQSDQPPYGQKLTMTVPPVPTLPTEPNASALRFSLTVGSPHRGLIRVPHSCPSGGFPFAADFTYADGSASSSGSATPCP